MSSGTKHNFKGSSLNLFIFTFQQFAAVRIDIAVRFFYTARRVSYCRLLSWSQLVFSSKCRKHRCYTL